jgi:hypothetical protein
MCITLRPRKQYEIYKMQDLCRISKYRKIDYNNKAIERVWMSASNENHEEQHSPLGTNEK